MRTEFLIKTWLFWLLLLWIAVRRLTLDRFLMLYLMLCSVTPQKPALKAHPVISCTAGTHTHPHTHAQVCAVEVTVQGLLFFLSLVIMIFFFIFVSCFCHDFWFSSCSRVTLLTTSAPIIHTEWKSSALHHSLTTWSDFILTVLCSVDLYICCFYAFTRKLSSHGLLYAGTGWQCWRQQ